MTFAYQWRSGLALRVSASTHPRTMTSFMRCLSLTQALGNPKSRKNCYSTTSHGPYYVFLLPCASKQRLLEEASSQTFVKRMTTAVRCGANYTNDVSWHGNVQFPSRRYCLIKLKASLKKALAQAVTGPVPVQVYLSEYTTNILCIIECSSLLQPF